MDDKSSEPKARWRPSTKKLRWAAIVLPALFLVGLDALRHTAFAGALHSLPGFVGTYAVIVTAAAMFSFGMFSLIDRLQCRLIDSNRQLSALNDIAKAAVAKLQLEELLQTSLDLILSNMKVDAGLICLVDLQREEHSVACHRGFSEELVRGIRRAKLGDDPVVQEMVRAYRRCAREAHPDRGGSDQEMGRVNRAYAEIKRRRRRR